MMTKSERQELGRRKWRENKGLGGWQYPTSFGKMYNSIQIFLLMLDKIATTRIIIVVNSDELRNEWRKEIAKMIGDRGKFLVETIHYFQNKKFEHHTDLLVLDEMSQYFSEDRSNIWNGTWVKFKFLLWLDATPTDRQKRDTKFYQLYPAVDIITKQEAEQNGWITSTQFINYAIELTEDEAVNYTEIENIIDQNFSKLNRNFDIVNKCLKGGDAEYELTAEDGSRVKEVFALSAYKYCTYIAEKNGWCEDYQTYMRSGFPLSWDKDSVEFVKNICAIWTPDKVMGYARKTMTAIRNRLDIVYMAKNKIKAVLEILEYYGDKQTIIFGQRTEFCTKVTKAINNQFGMIAVEYHSNIESRPLMVDSNGELTLLDGTEYAVYATGKNKGSPKIYGKKTLRDLAIEAIEKGKARVIVTGSALDRGINKPKIEIGIVTGATQNSSQAEQRNGRISRIDVENSNKEAIFINLYVPNTKEHEFLIQNKKANVRWITNLKQLKEVEVEDYDV